jgi:Cu2+-exporting ATPase
LSICTISVSDMHCAACAGKIRRALRALDDIQATHINPVRRQVLVEHGTATDPLEILSTIESAGFSPTLSGLDDHDARQRDLLKRLGIAGLAMMQVMMAAIALYAGALDGIEPVYERLLQFTSLFFTIPVVCYSAVPFFTSALSGLRHGGRLSMDVPIALAIAIAFTTSLIATISGEGEVYYDSVVMFTFLLLGARYIDNRLQHRFELTSHLLAALPKNAWRLVDGKQETVAIEALAAGDTVRVPEGAQVPVDGSLTSQRALLDEAVLTGESDWLEKATDAQIYAGTLNRGPAFTMRASGTVDQSRIADIAQLAEQAEVKDAQITRLTDRIAGIFIPTVLSLAAVTFIGWQFVDPSRALIAALTVLVVSCPCALSLATPAALTAAMTRLRQLGVVLTNSQTLERVLNVDRMYIDKTGTLTTDTPSIERTEVLTEGQDQRGYLTLAAELQQHSSHPYARAFQSLEINADIELNDVETVTGQGVRGLWQTGDAVRDVRIGSAAFAGADNIAAADDRDVYLAIDGRPVARFVLSNQIRSDAVASINTLKSLAVSPVMLSGDSEARCAETAATLGIDYLARQTPEAKLAAIRADQAAGHKVLMLGDGINDVPVLAGADVSAAVVEASDLVKSKADVLLLSSRLSPLAGLLSLARGTRRITRQNLLWAAAYNLTAIPIAAFGFMPPWLAALGMAASSTLVMLNATRLLSFGIGERMEA